MHIPRKHKNEQNRQKIGEMPKSIISKFWSIIDSSLMELLMITVEVLLGYHQYTNCLLSDPMVGYLTK